MKDKNKLMPPYFTPSRFIIFIVSVAALFSGLMWYWHSPPRDKINYVTATVTRGDIAQIVTAYGIIKPRDLVDVGAQVSGILKKVYIDFNDVVKKGDLIAEIDDDIYQAKVEADKANIESLQAQLDAKNAQLVLADLQNKRAEELFKEKAISEDTAQTNKSLYDQAVGNVASLVAQLKLAKATLKADEANLTYTRIRAPMNGTLVSKVAEEGQALNANQATPIILRLANLDVMTVRAQVSEADITKLKPGMLAYFNTLGELDRRRTGTIKSIQPTPEIINGAVFYNVMFDVNNEDHSLLPQMSAQIFFTINEAKNVLLVPIQALSPPLKITEDDSLKNKKPKSQSQVFQVYALHNNSVESRTVEIGIKGRLEAEVLSGLSEGELVIVNRHNIAPPSTPEKTAKYVIPTMPGGK